MSAVPVRFFGGPIRGETRQLDLDYAMRTVRIPIAAHSRETFGIATLVEPLVDAGAKLAEYRYVCRWFLVDRDGNPNLAGPLLVDMEWQTPHELIEAQRAMDRLREAWGLGSMGWPESRRAWRYDPPWLGAADRA